MLREDLINGGYLVKLVNGGLAVENIQNAHRGMIVQSAYSALNGGRRERGQYHLTRRVIAGSDLWHVRRLGSYVIAE